MSDNSEAEGCLAIVTTVILVSMVAVSCTLRQTTYTPNVACEVIKAENVRSGRRGENRLYCKEEIFKIADDLLTGNFRSADMYVALSELPKGSEISLDVWGIRFGPTSSMRTVIDWRK